MKKVNIKKMTVVVVLALITILLVSKLWAKHCAALHLEEKYGGAIVLENVDFSKVRGNLFCQEYSVKAVYAGVDFIIGNGSDTYTEQYHMKRYAELLLSNDMDNLISNVSIIMLEHLSGTPVLDKTNLLFHLTLKFKENFNSKEEFVDGVQKILAQLDFTNLSRCDTLMAYAYVGGQFMCCTISPMKSPVKSEILTAITPALRGG